MDQEMGNKTEFETRNGREMGNKKEFETRNGLKWETRNKNFQKKTGKTGEKQEIQGEKQEEKKRKKQGGGWGTMGHDRLQIK